MRQRLMIMAAVLLMAALPLTAESSDGPLYQIEIDKDPITNNNRVHQTIREQDGKAVLFVTVQFKIKRGAENVLALDTVDEIVVEEDGERVANLQISQPAQQALTTILAMDISGSMADHGKMAEARQAAKLFLDRLHPKADCGLILFDHAMRVVEGPAGNPERLAEHRDRLRAHIDNAKPGGGTAYLDATAKAVQMLKSIRGRRAVVVMTDGVDLNSQSKLEEVIKLAIVNDVPVYTLGVGEPGKNEPVTTVLTFDASNSMRRPAALNDSKSKIDAAKEAAVRFVDLMRPGCRTTLLPFNNEVPKPKPFSDNKAALSASIRAVQLHNETRMYDGVIEAIKSLDAEKAEGKKAVIVMTDGMDTTKPAERREQRLQESIKMAKKAKIPLYTLGFGADKINETAMKRMANETGGKYYHALNQQKLIEIFENLSIQLHDDGIDEATLRQLAERTGGKYFPARDVKELRFIYEGLVDELQTTYTVTFPSIRQVQDGTERKIEISVRRNGTRVSDISRTGYNVHGVVVPEMDYRVYLVALTMLAGLLALPAGLRRYHRPASSQRDVLPGS